MSSSITRRRLGRRQLAVVMAAGLATVGTVALKAQEAQAHETVVQYPVACTVVGNQTATLTVEHDPLNAPPGGLYTIKVKTKMPAISVNMPIKSMQIKIPAPAAVGGIVGATFSGGNLDGTYAISPDPALLLNFKPKAGTEVLANNILLPDMNITASILPTATGNITWAGPSLLTIDTDAVKEECKPTSAAPPLLVSPVDTTPAPVPNIGPFGSPNSVTYPLVCGVVGPLSTQLATAQTANATAGGRVGLSVKTTIGTVPVSLPVKTMQITIPAPAQVTGVVAAKFVGGKFDAKYSLAPGPNLVIDLTPKAGQTVNTDTIELPEIQFDTAIAPGTEGQTLTWAGPSKIVIDVGVLKETCNAAAGAPPLTTTPIGSGGGGTSTSTSSSSTSSTSSSSTSSTNTSTSSSSSSSTSSTSTSTSSTSTSTSTSTTSTTTSTTMPTTRPTTPPTTPDHEFFLFKIIRMIFCFLFGWFC